jgi:hypothetical protein
MRFNELRQDDKEDRSAKWSVDDTRRPRITLRHLNKMRNMKEMSKVENDEKIKNYQGMYASATGE